MKNFSIISAHDGQAAGASSFERLLFWARAHRQTANLPQAFFVIRDLAQALAAASKLSKTSASPQLARLLLEELAIWCYVAYEQGAADSFLFQAQKCFERYESRYALDAEAKVYCAFILWAKGTLGCASGAEKQRCFSLLRSLVGQEGALMPQREIVWFRLGCLYNEGIGCVRNRKEAKRCFDQARALGFQTPGM